MSHNLEFSESLSDSATIREQEKRAPYEEIARKYHELLFAVERKFLGESRHETALRYIREKEAEALSGTACDAEKRERATFVGAPMSLGELAKVIEAGQQGGISEALRAAYSEPNTERKEP